MDLDFKNGGEHYGLYFPPLRPIEQSIRATHHGKTVSYRYEPGNATRYDVVFSTFDFGFGEEVVMAIANFRKAMIVPGPMHTPSQISYMKEKLDINEGDCYALMPLINHFLETHGS